MTAVRDATIGSTPESLTCLISSAFACCAAAIRTAAPSTTRGFRMSALIPFGPPAPRPIRDARRLTNGAASTRVAQSHTIPAFFLLSG
ncbi:hypothetical protein GCM10025331_24950 [Actinoplanes utahensis]|nr:hypothetical protein Aut01nite_05380 [Actinoplanes utahensis]